MHKPDAAPRRRLAIGSAAALILAAAFSLTALIPSDSGISPLWRPVLRLHDRAAVAMGSDAIGDIYLGEERMMHRMLHYDSRTLADSIAALNTYAEKSGAPVYFAAVPTAAGVYADSFPENAPRGDEKTVLQTVSGQLAPGITQIDLLSRFTADRGEPLYYRTDSRLTAYGAFAAYRASVRRLGYDPAGFGKVIITHYDSEYYGDLAQQARYYAYAPDVLDLYAFDGAAFTVTALHENGEVPLEGCFLPERAEASGDSYDVYALQTEPVLRLESDRAGKDLLLLCDDCGAGIVPLLMQNYRSVTAVHLPHAMQAGLDWEALAAPPENGWAQVLILLGPETLCTQPVRNPAAD